MVVTETGARNKSGLRTADADLAVRGIVRGMSIANSFLEGHIELSASEEWKAEWESQMNGIGIVDGDIKNNIREGDAKALKVLQGLADIYDANGPESFRKAVYSALADSNEYIKEATKRDSTIGAEMNEWISLIQEVSKDARSSSKAFSRSMIKRAAHKVGQNIANKEKGARLGMRTLDERLDTIMDHLSSLAVNKGDAVAREFGELEKHVVIMNQVSKALDIIERRNTNTMDGALYLKRLKLEDLDKGSGLRSYREIGPSIQVATEPTETMENEAVKALTFGDVGDAIYGDVKATADDIINSIKSDELALMSRSELKEVLVEASRNNRILHEVVHHLTEEYFEKNELTVEEVNKIRSELIRVNSAFDDLAGSGFGRKAMISSREISAIDLEGIRAELKNVISDEDNYLMAIENMEGKVKKNLERYIGKDGTEQLFATIVERRRTIANLETMERDRKPSEGTPNPEPNAHDLNAS